MTNLRELATIVPIIKLLKILFPYILNNNFLKKKFFGKI
jgi:hypothetical protein